MITFRYINEGLYEVLDITGHIGGIVEVRHPLPSGSLWMAYDNNSDDCESASYRTLPDAMDHFDREGA